MAMTTERVWEDFSRQLHSFIAGRIADPSSVDDLLQEVFIKIHSGIDSLGDETKIRSWVFRIARNTVIDYYRKRKAPHDDIDGIQVADAVEEPTVAQEVAAGLREMVDTLPEKYARALILVEFDGLSQSELAGKLGLSLSGAKSRVQRGRDMLRDALMRCCHFQFDRYGTIVDACPASCCCCN